MTGVTGRKGMKPDKFKLLRRISCQHCSDEPSYAIKQFLYCVKHKPSDATEADRIKCSRCEKNTVKYIGLTKENEEIYFCNEHKPLYVME